MIFFFSFKSIALAKKRRKQKISEMKKVKPLFHCYIPLHNQVHEWTTTQSKTNVNHARLGKVTIICMVVIVGGMCSCDQIVAEGERPSQNFGLLAASPTPFPFQQGNQNEFLCL